MTRNDSRPSLWERFVNWETGDESVLDGEIEQSMDQAAPQEAGGEVYASAEKRADDHRTALVEEERSYYSRVHEWSLHKGVKFHQPAVPPLGGAGSVLHHLLPDEHRGGPAPLRRGGQSL